MKRQIAAALALLFTAACAAGSDPVIAEHRLATVISHFADGRHDAIARAMDALEYDGVIVPHEPGPSRTLRDARLHDINGVPGEAVWFSLDADPCYPAASVFGQFGTAWEELTSTLWQTSNAAFVIRLKLHAAAPACVARMEFWTIRR